MTIKISIESDNVNSLSHQLITAHILGYLKTFAIPIQHEGPSNFIINEEHISSEEENKNFLAGSVAYRYAVINKGFKGSEAEWFTSLLAKRSAIEQTVAYTLPPSLDSDKV